MNRYDCRVNFKKQDPIYRPAIFRHVGISMSVSGEAKSVVVLDLPAHRGFPTGKLHIPSDATLYQVKGAQAENRHPGTILLGLPHQLQQASRSAGVSIGLWDAQALLYDLNRVRRYVPGCA